MTPDAIRRLGSAVAARKSRDLAELERLLVEDRALEAEIATLAATAAAELADACALPPERQAARLAWIEARRALASRRRAELVPAIAAARARAVASLGREQALEHLAERADAAEERKRAARVEREMPAPR